MKTMHAGSTKLAPARSSRRKLGLSCSVAAVSAVAIALGLFSAGEGLTAGIVAPAALRTRALASGADDSIAQDFSRRALNALLVPLLDDDKAAALDRRRSEPLLRAGDAG